jgi:transcriptional regulator with XRE-family HTH domain
MSPRKLALHVPPRVLATVNRVSVSAGSAIRAGRVRRGWTLEQLASRAGLSVSAVQGIEAGRAASVVSYARLSDALGLRLEMLLDDATKRSTAPRDLQVDHVHSAMGEFEVGHLRRFGFALALDEPYQHFQFAGRADVVAWEPTIPALLHIENRTRFPNLQEAAGSYGAKRAYLPGVLAERLEIGRWRSLTHVMVCLWSAEMLHAIRIRPESFRSICPDESAAFAAWWNGRPVAVGNTSSLIVLDPLAAGRERVFVDLEEALRARPRYAGYAAAARRLENSG